MNPIDQFRDAMYQAGITPPASVDADGLLHRFDVDGDRRNSRNGWYALHLDGRPAGVFGSWKTGQSEKWTADGQQLTDGERQRYSELAVAAKAQRKRERLQSESQAADFARNSWRLATPASAAHPYLLKKAVKPHGLRQQGTGLLVPLVDQYGALWSVQTILAEGTKRFQTGGRIAGTFSPIGDLTSPPTVLICEGWATGATLHQETGHLVLCAMNCGNLLAVAKAARAAWANADLVICADDDRFTDGNPGMTKATEAAKATGARLTYPTFPSGATGTDFNDLAAIRRMTLGDSRARARCGTETLEEPCGVAHG